MRLLRLLKMKLAYKVARPVGKVLPTAVLRSLCWPKAAADAAREIIHYDYADTPHDEAGRGRLLRLWRQRTGSKLANRLMFWTDMLPDPRWRRLCRFEGSREGLDRIEARTRPVVLATVHFGPVAMLVYWFRSRGVPLAALTVDDNATRSADRLRLDGACNRAAGFGDLPHTFSPRQLRRAVDFLRPNRALLVVMTGEAGPSIVASAGALRLLMAPGALRLAALAEADVIPCIISATPFGSVTIRVGEPLAAEGVADEDRHPETCNRLLAFFEPTLRSLPGQAEPHLLYRMRQVRAAPGLSSRDEGVREMGDLPLGPDRLLQ